MEHHKIGLLMKIGLCVISKQMTLPLRRRDQLYFLSVVGDEIYTLLRGLVAPKSPRDIKLDELLNI